MIALVTCKDAQLARKVFGPIIGWPKQLLVTLTGVCKHGCSVTCLPATTLWSASSAETVTYSRYAKDTALLVFHNWVNMSTGRKCLGTSLRSAGNIPSMYRSINDMTSGRLTARFLTTPNNTRVRRSPIWRCSITSFDPIGCLLMLLSFSKSRGFTRGTQVGCARDSLIKFWWAPVSIRHLSLSKLCAYRSKQTYVLWFVLVKLWTKLPQCIAVEVGKSFCSPQGTVGQVHVV